MARPVSSGCSAGDCADVGVPIVLTSSSTQQSVVERYREVTGSELRIFECRSIRKDAPYSLRRARRKNNKIAETYRIVWQRSVIGGGANDDREGLGMRTVGEQVVSNAITLLYVK